MKDQKDKNADSGTQKSVTHGKKREPAITEKIVYSNMTTTTQQENSLKHGERDHGKETKNSKDDQKARITPNMINPQMNQEVTKQDTPHHKHLKMIEETMMEHHQQDQLKGKTEQLNKVHQQQDQHDMHFK